MEDLIPFLIVMLISIVGAIGNRKKKREQTSFSQAPQKPLQDEDMPEWFKKFIPADEEEFLTRQGSKETITPPLVKPIVEQAPAAPVRPGIFDRFSGVISPEERENLMKKEGERAITPILQVVKNQGKLQGSTGQAQSILKSNFNLKEAVIYTEILKPKYF